MKLTRWKHTVDIDPQTAHLTALAYGDISLLDLPQDKPVFSLTALDTDNNRVTLLPRHGREEGDTLVFDGLYHGQKRLNIRAALIAGAHDFAPAFRVQVDNNEPGYRVTETLFELPGLTFGEGADTYLLYPHHAGEKIQDPCRALRSEKYQSFWRAGTKEINGEWVRECNYCGLCSMSYMYLQSSRAGLYFASQDERFPVTGLMVKTGGDESQYLSLGFRVHHMIHPGEGWQSGQFVLCLSGEDWHAGARRYRRWISPRLAKHSDPGFLKEQAALNQCYNFKRVEEIQNRFEDIPAMWEEGSKRGVNHMFIASWNRTGFDSFYPEYYPDMELGTALDFRRGIDYVNSHGGFATLYVNARLSDMSSDFHRRFLSRMQIENERGEALTETYGPHTFTLNCPSDEQWQHMLVDICDFAAQAYGVKGIYLDQLASAEPFACYNPRHAHADPGQFNQGYLKILEELRGRLKARDADAYLMTENCGDIYAPYVWGNLTWNGADYDEFYNMFRYTFPQFVQVNMCNDRAWEKDPHRREACFYADIQRCVLMGNILWIGITSRYLGKPELAAHFEYLTTAVAFRKTIARQVSAGVYMDDAYVTRLDTGLAASCFHVSPDETLLLIGDCALAGGEAAFTLPYSASRAEAFDERGQPVRAALSAGRLTVALDGQRRLVRVTAYK